MTVDVIVRTGNGTIAPRTNGIAAIAAKGTRTLECILAVVIEMKVTGLCDGWWRRREMVQAMNE